MSENTLSEVVPLTPKPTVSYVSVTPAIAERWLRANHVNRNVREKKVNQYASDMAAGYWTFSNDAICFDPDGKLLNGQHRLTAVVRSGVTVVMMVAKNMSAATMMTMDSGSARTAGDALTFAGEVNTQALAAVIRLAILYADGRIYKNTKVQGVSHTAISDFLAENPLLRHSATVGRNARTKVDAPPSTIAVAHWIIAESAGVAVADHYIGQLANRTGEPEGSAVLAIDSRLRQLRRNKTTLSQRAYVALLVKGWNYYARDHRVTSVNVAADARIPQPARWSR